MHRKIFALIPISISILLLSLSCDTSGLLTSKRNVTTNQFFFFDLERNLLIKIADGIAPQFIPNNNKILYLEGYDPKYDKTINIHTVNSDGANNVNVAAAKAFTDFSLVRDCYGVSPNGDKIFFNGIYDNNITSLYSVNVDGSSITNLTAGIELNDFFRISGVSLGSKKILFRYTNGIGLMDLSTKSIMKIKGANDSIFFNLSNFSSDNEAIIYLENNWKIGETRIRVFSLKDNSDKIIYSHSINSGYPPDYLWTLPDNKIIFNDEVQKKIIYLDIYKGLISYSNSISIGEVLRPVFSGTRMFCKRGNDYLLLDPITMKTEAYSLPFPTGMSFLSDYSPDLKKFIFSKQ